MVSQAIPYLAASQYDVLSLDHTVQPKIARDMVNKQHDIITLPEYAAEQIKPMMTAYLKPGVEVKDGKLVVDITKTNTTTLQGNIDPYLLYAEHHIIQDKVEKVITEFGVDKYICNLGHGMLPTHPVDAVRTLTTTVKRVSQRLVAENKQ
eukprot:UN04115